MRGGLPGRSGHQDPPRSPGTHVRRHVRSRGSPALAPAPGRRRSRRRGRPAPPLDLREGGRRSDHLRHRPRQRPARGAAHAARGRRRGDRAGLRAHHRGAGGRMGGRVSRGHPARVERPDRGSAARLAGPIAHPRPRAAVSALLRGCRPCPDPAAQRSGSGRPGERPRAPQSPPPHQDDGHHRGLPRRDPPPRTCAWPTSSTSGWRR